MLGRLKSSRLDFLKASEGRIPKHLATRIAKCDDLTALSNIVKNVVQLRGTTHKGRINTIVDYYANQKNNVITNLLQRVSQIKPILTPEYYSRRIITVRFMSYDKRCHVAGLRLSMAAKLMNIPCSGPIGLPRHIKRWTVLKSPFKYKRHQETFEQRFMRSIVTLDVRDKGDLMEKLIKFIKCTAYKGVDISITTRRFIETDQLYTNPYVKEKIGWISEKDMENQIDYASCELNSNVLSRASQKVPINNEDIVKENIIRI
ncbi:uncharacterized protein LOC126304650 isoform X1 [Schistocerca gregaria]|uniref:uncharacterized protein LOC126304650 isoform X1 n=1 Tax=Schistocerca gregaria TaxID=7010 RepID=UPI00211DABB0|nr:uncharacterized protein LOC126304650 isoform X1 [Schistocerca gregaria]